MATVVSSSCRPRTDTARHCTCEPFDRADRDGYRPDVVVVGQVRFGVAIVDGHPDPAVGIDPADVEVRRRTAGIGTLVGGGGIRRGAWAQPLRGVDQGLVDAVDQIVAQDRGDRDARRQQAEGHQHQGRGNQRHPQRDAAPRSAAQTIGPIRRAQRGSRRT